MKNTLTSRMNVGIWRIAEAYVSVASTKDYRGTYEAQVESSCDQRTGPSIDPSGASMVERIKSPSARVASPD